MDLQLKGKRALVTGGSKGIGKAVARVLPLEGAQVQSAVATAAKQLGGAIDILVNAAAEVGGCNSIHRQVDARAVADIVACLCSPRSRAINGDAIAAGGGTPRAIHY